MDRNMPGSVAEYVLVNLESGLRLAARVRLAGDSAARRKGLLGVDRLDPESGLWIMPCEAIHTFGMKMPIDVLFLDRTFKVKKLLEALPPCRLALCLRADSVVEMRAGTITGSKTKIGDRLSIQRVSEGYGLSEIAPISVGTTCPSS